MRKGGDGLGVRNTTDEGKTALYNSVTNFAFGPVFDDEFAAEDFCNWFRKEDGRDLRDLKNKELQEVHARWYDQYEAAEEE